MINSFLLNEWPQVENRAGGGKGCVRKKSDRREAVAVIQVEGTESGSSWRQIRMKRRGWIQRMVRGGVNWEFGDWDTYVLLILCLKQITNENIVCPRRNSA